MQKKSAKQMPIDWHPADIKAELQKKNLTLRALSVANDLHPDSLKNALRTDYPRGERIIAAALGFKPEVIWPSRYAKRSIKGVVPPHAIHA